MKKSNKKFDTKFVGMPTEAWGVLNNIRPLMCTPQSQFSLATDEKKSVNIELKK
jgi:uncharacterized protein (DUF2141 family)